METLKPKFKIGDEVWAAQFWPHTEKSEPCPDCLGKKWWLVETPAGEKFDLPCNTCSRGWQGPTGFINRISPTATAVRLTIGSVQTDTAAKEPIRYMCIETGVGSGTLWAESDLFCDEADAKRAAEQKGEAWAAAENKRLADIEASKKHERQSKPDHKDRRIRELEKQIIALKSGLTPPESAVNC